ncbi:MAG: choice-of-anchor J domain-containing protein, partial [Candidatus Cloacimonetes bacterium]|nr:choice-of-anchor J domain-containing protein [Candidatus Cloacimonadota bacterium]
NDWLITPPLNTGSYLKLKWWDAVESASYPNSYKVLLSTTDTDPASFTTELADITCSSTTWTEHNLTINNTSGTAYIAFYQYASGATYYDFGIDDLVIEELPLTPPLAPTLTYPLELTGLPQAGFNLTWTPDPASGPVDYYIVYFWDDDSAIGDGPMWETSGTSFDPTQALTDPITYGYLDRWNWTVQAYSSAYPETEAFATESWFEIQDDPTIVVDPGTPWTEGFENATFPPNNWALISGSGNWTRSVAAGGYGDSTASAYAGFYNISGSTPFSMVTPLLDLSALTTPTLMFDYAYATYSGELDRMDVYYSIDGGLSYSTLLEMPGGADGILNTGGTTTGSFVPTAGQWNTQTLALPAGTNMLKFTATSAYGNNLYLDNIFMGNPPVFWDLTMLDPVGSGTVVPAIGEHSYIENTVVNLTAQPGLSFFDKWEVDGVQFSTDRIAPLTMDANHEAQAFFSLPAGSLAEDFNLGDPVPGEWSETATTVAWEMGDDTFFFNMFDSFTMIGQVATDPEEMLITPEVILDGSINKFSYWLAGGNNIYGYGSSTVQVKYQAPGTRVWTNLGAPIDLATNEALQYVSLDLSAIPNGTYQFAFAVSSTFDYSTYLSWVGIDNVVGPRLADVVMNDLAVTQVNYPNQIISDGETAVLSATIKNNGLNPQSGTQVTFTINDGRTVLTTNIGTLNYNETEIVTVNYSTVGGRHTITASVPADDNLTNNSATTQGIIAVEGNLAEGFEGTVDGWTVGDTSYWAITNVDWLPPYEGNWAAYCYGATFTDDRLVTPKLVLTGSEELNFYASFGNQSTGAASLAVDYSADGVTWTNILPAFAPTENSQLYTVDLSTIPAGEYYLAFNGSGTNDGTYNTILNLDFVFGPELAIVDVDTPANVAIALVGGTPQLSWEEVPAAGSYNIYSSADPYGEFTLLGSTAALSYDLTADQAHLFYHVTASTDVRQVAAANIPNVSLRAQTSLNAAQAPQITPAGNLKTNNRNRQQVILPKK